MSGSCSGVSARIKELNPRAVFIHCCAHRLNLALVDTVKSIPVTKDFFALLQTLFSQLLLRHTKFSLVSTRSLVRSKKFV